MNKTFFIGILSACVAHAVQPSIEDGSITFRQDSGRNVTITYRLEGTSAIVTADILTNGVSMGEATFSDISGAVNRLVHEGLNTITWDARKAWPDNIATNVTVKLTAWQTNSPPDYCVVDLSSPYDVRYYVSTNALPDGGLANRTTYCRDKLVLRKIPAAGAMFRMGMERDTRGGKQVPHMVQMTSDYYFSIYTVTVGQYNKIAGTTLSGNGLSGNGKYGEPLENPIQNIAYADLRGSGYSWPQNGHDVAADSVFGTLRANTGLAFDLPTDAQWEYACRAGTTTRWWFGDSVSGLTGEQKMEYGWFGWVQPRDQFYGTGKNDWGYTHPVGLLKPNPWGLYDLYGNAWEACLDYFVNDSAAWNWMADDYRDPVTDPMGVASGTARVIRGGAYSNGPEDADSSMRHNGKVADTHGFRLVCPACATR